MVRKPSAMFSRGGRNGKTVDILFVLEEPASDGRIVTRERQVKKVETSSTTYSRLKDMARFHLQIKGAIELWHLEDGCPNTMNLRPTEPISKAIMKDSKLQVEKLGFHEDVYGLAGSHSASILAMRDSDEKVYSVAAFPSDVLDIGDSSIPIATPIASYPPDRISSSDEQSDAEIARALSMELNGLNTASRASKKPSKIFHFASTPRPKPLGKLVAKASCSQFSIDGGRSACTSICLYAAAQLLSRINETPGCITTNALDGYLEFGTTLYQNEHLYGLQGDHTSVDDLWNQPCFAEVVRGLVRCSPISGITSQSSFEDGLMTAMSYAHSRSEQSVALVVTKPPETILMVCKDVHRSAPWFLFDSHGRDYDFPKKAYVTQLGSVETAAAALLHKFPSVQGLGASLHAQQMNMYEAHPIILRDTMADKEKSDLETALARSTPPDDPDKAPWDEFKRDSNECDESNTTESFLQDYFPENLTSCCKSKPPPTEQNKSPIEDVELLLTSSLEENEELPPTTHSHVSPSAQQATNKPSCPVAPPESTSYVNTFSKPKVGSASAIGSTVSLPEQQSTTRPSLPSPSSESTPRDAKAPSSTPATNENVHQTRPSNPFLQDTEQQSPSPSFELASRVATTPSCIPVTRSNAKQPTSTPGLQDTDIVRDPITGMLFADPVFCDKGHTHERSSIESHFRARREMKAEEEERLQQEVGGAPPREDSCGAGSNFDPTCPLTSEPISEILIINDQLDRMVAMLVESGIIPLEDGELEDWRERREEKTRLARERRTQEAARQEETPHEAHQEEPRPPAAPITDSTTVRIQHPLRRCNPAGHTDLGISVTLCPSDWEESAKIQIPIPRCSNGCCRSRLRKSNRGTCARCTQILCSNCLVFHVGDTSQNDRSAKKHLICPECVLQVSNTLAVGVDPESNSEESQLVKELDTVMTRFFTSLRERTSVVQHQVTQFNKHQSFVTFAERLSKQIVELEQTKDTLGNQIRQAREQAEAAKHDENSATDVTADSPTPEEMGLQTKVSDLQAKYNEIDWTDEEGMIQGSLLEYQLNEAMGELAVARSSRPSTTTSARGAAGANAKQTSELEAKYAAVQAKYDALLAKGPSNEHDHKYAIKLTQLADEFEKLSTKLMQARETAPAVRVRKSASSRSSSSTSSSNGDANSRVKLGNIASSLASFITMPFSSAKSSATVSSLKDTPTSAAPIDDTIGSNIPAPVLNAASVAIATSDLAAIGVIGIEEVSELPLSLHYPSARLRNQVLVLRNELELAQLESERSLDEEYASHRRQLQTRVEQLEDELVTMRREVASAQASAAEEERLQRDRVARREAAERERQRIERERATEAARLRREKERLETARRQQERETRKALRGLDLRKCGNPKCGFGPFEKFNCNDMGAHNDTFFYIDSKGRRQQRRRNECPQCRWTNSDWNQWPKFNA